MPTVASSAEMSLQVLAAIARGAAHEMADIEAGLVQVDGVAHFVLAFMSAPARNATEREAAAHTPLQVFVTSPLGGVLITQQLTELVTSKGGIVAILRDAMGPEPTAAPVVPK